MNKNIIPVIIIIGIIVVGAAGWAAWNAYNSSGLVVEAPETTQTPPPTPTPTPNPLQPGAPVVKTEASTVPYISTVVVRGTVNPNGEITTYWYEYGETTALGLKTAAYLLGSGYTTIYTPAYITGLRSNTNYYFKLSAKNIFGTVHGATYGFRTNTTPVPQGTAPTTSTTASTDIERTTANLHGRINPNGSDTTFWFEYGTTSELGAVTALQSAGSSNTASNVSVSVSSLRPLTKYYFRLNAQNQFGTVNGQILSFTTKGPPEASSPIVNTVSATAITKSSAKLNAMINPNGATTVYWFEYSTDASLSLSVKNTQDQSLGAAILSLNISANITNLDSNTKYYYRIVARNQYGTVKADIESFTTKQSSQITPL